MFFEDKIKTNKTEFLAKVKTIAKDLGIKPDWLMSAMWLENQPFNPSAINSDGCVGLIQFCKITYEGEWGLTQSYLANLSNVEQLEYVKKYILMQNKYWNNSGKIKSYLDLHTLIFFPKAMEFKRNQVFETSDLTAKQIVDKNKNIDLNKDFKITKKEFGKYTEQQFAKSGLSKLEQNKLFEKGIYSTEFKIFVVSLSLITTAFLIYKATK